MRKDFPGGTYPVTLIVRDLRGGAAATTSNVTVAELSITPVSFTGGNFAFTFPTAPGRSYTVERSLSLAPASWTPLETTAGDGSVRSFTGSGAGGTRELYRVRAQ